MNIEVYRDNKLFFNKKEYKCSLGRNGITKDKKEGDGSTPAGCFYIRKILYRKDKVKKPITSLPTEEIKKNDGWCDDVSNDNYNKQIKLPSALSHENLWRNDDLYDIVAVVGYNDNPPIKKLGSAIFIHIAGPNYSPTAGCVGLSKEDLLKILRNFGPKDKICIKL